MLTDRFLVVLDPRRAYPQAAAAAGALRRHDWAACRAVLDAAEPAERTALTQFLGNRPRTEGFLRGVLDADPGDSAAAAVLGVYLINRAWDIRSSYTAGWVTRRQFEGFHRRLEQADQVLQRAVTYAPADPAVWTARLTVGRGLSLDDLENSRRYAGLAAIDPGHLPGQLARLTQLCPKWGGSWAEVDEFAQEVSAAAAPGAHNHVLIAETYIERELGAGRPARGRTFDLEKAVYTAANNSVFHPAFRRTVGWVRVASSFALAFSIFADKQSAGRVWAMLGPYLSPHPWSYLGDPRSAVRRTGVGRMWRGR